MNFETELTNQQRSKRLKQLRALAGISMNALSEHSGIPIDTIKTWESVNRRTCVTSIGAQRIIEAYQHLGINASIDWLLHGTPPAPNDINCLDPELQDSAAIEAQQFHQQHANACILAISDNALAPSLLIGDWVGGIWQDIHDFVAQPHMLALFEDINSGQTLCRRLLLDDHGYLHALNTNPDSLCDPIHQLNIKRFAPLSRLWRPRCNA